MMVATISVARTVSMFMRIEIGYSQHYQVIWNTCLDQLGKWFTFGRTVKCPEISANSENQMSVIKFYQAHDSYSFAIFLTWKLLRLFRTLTCTFSEGCREYFCVTTISFLGSVEIYFSSLESEKECQRIEAVGITYCLLWAIRTCIPTVVVFNICMTIRASIPFPLNLVYGCRHQMLSPMLLTRYEIWKLKIEHSQRLLQCSHNKLYNIIISSECFHLFCVCVCLCHNNFLFVVITIFKSKHNFTNTTRNHSIVV